MVKITWEILSEAELERAEKTTRYEKIFATHDEIAEYLKSKDESWLVRVEQVNGGVL